MLLFRDTDPVLDRDLVLKCSSLWIIRHSRWCWLPRSQNRRLRLRCKSRDIGMEKRRSVKKKLCQGTFNIHNLMKHICRLFKSV